MKTQWILLVVMVLVWVGGCDSKSESPQTVVVFAAASTTNAVTDIGAAFTQSTGIEVTTNFASSSALAQQIESGADADVYISANQKWADYLEEKGFSNQQTTLLKNRIVIIVPQDSSLTAENADVLLSPEVKNIAMGETSSVPVGRYGKQALEKLGLWEQLEGKVTAAKDVRSALAYVETEAAEAGIVYSTDAAISDQVKVIYSFPEDATAKPISYPAMILKQAVTPAAAKQFYEFLQGPQADAIFKQYGFLID